MSKILKVSMIFALIGLPLTIVGLFAIGFNFDKLNNKGDPITYEETYNYQDINNFKLSIPYGEVEFKVNNDIENVKLKIETFEKEKWTYNINEGLFLVENTSNSFVNSWWNIFSSYRKSSKVYIEIPSAATFDKVDLSLSAGNMAINDLSFNELSTKVSAGKLTLNNIQGTSIISKNSAGKTLIDNAKVKSMDLTVSAGELRLNSVSVDELKFKVSAGNLNANINGSLESYDVNVEVSAGNCNINNQNVASNKKIEGKVSAGDAYFTFNN